MQNEPKQIYLCWIFIFSDSESEYAKHTRLSNFLSSHKSHCQDIARSIYFLRQQNFDIVRFRSLTHRINSKFMCLSAY